MKNQVQYHKVYGDQGFGRVEPSSDIELALARLCEDRNGVQVPIIRFWFDPREKFARAHQTMRDRASGVRHPVNNGPSAPAWSHTTAINGTPTLTVTNTWFGPFTFSEPEYTFISTIRPRVPLAGTNMSILSPVGSGTYGPNLAIQSNGALRVYNGPNVTARLTVPGDMAIFDTNFLLGTSFSQENGVAMLKNGSVVASNAADKNAPDAPTLRFLGATTQGGQFEGDVGICMLIAADLTRPIWASARDLIWQYLSDQSGIALA